mmetsp:Transcript_35872/g.55051  ORF Transcript_35872/g.55051 Transcript_35872/m.55051 type:complete len:181 (+) Transcript_35872:988-1530(+)|eukprot:CAMPEP_0170493748 /NCGR_PEP_ID=MMETSP0208-20121228/14244_1 /TAXON_ID=197538 /ORGANISM="Strombidium inclinatum, Strain S3" /LENGTH=180 /DNA_ID=CAMNT_0010769703 /DNA_START=988 /DNA_END=1530 /DNA_ORIENTATION=+
MSRDILYISWGHLTLIILITFYTITSLPDSAEYLYSKGRFNEARDSLHVAARMNGVKTFKKDEIVFDKERALQEQERSGTQGDEDAPKQPTYPIDDKQYVANLILMCFMFSIFSFCFWLIDYQQEYLGTDIYVNFYVAGFVSISSGHLNLIMSSRYGMKTSVQIIQTISMISCGFIIMVQ